MAIVIVSRMHLFSPFCELGNRFAKFYVITYLLQATNTPTTLQAMRWGSIILPRFGFILGFLLVFIIRKVVLYYVLIASSAYVMYNILIVYLYNTVVS